MRRRDVLRASLLAAPALLTGRALQAAGSQVEDRGENEPVDVELILAVDVSRSVDSAEQELQFNGYAAAFRDRRLVEGIVGGPIGAIACMMFTWSDWQLQEVMVPWARIDGPASAAAFSDRIAEAPRRSWLYTSISGAMDYASRSFGQGFEGTRRVVDISGDGVNNSGRPVADARADALSKNIVLNGLAVLDRTPGAPDQGLGQPALDEYYRDQVIGGPGSFLVVAEGFNSFEAAVRRKIIREIAWNPPAGPLVERVG
ncbi:DUF1194 domain-containing protein [Roseomonas sp. NAR14]|uniref:DUF1194 domain-containing protein n=1 Tax=Roseomonas acroporae TaxID=2937791 RepID=A0A9X2BVV6_9PROT|nr:DUF1194 domain-containing protein [Roseomonas acroporae]MCK8783135.1 DUF1194 domain-containing protein [Roseomonas acroporae]